MFRDVAKELHAYGEIMEMQMFSCVMCFTALYVGQSPKTF